MDQEYRSAMAEQLAELEEELLGLHEVVIEKGQLTRYENRAAERLLQLLIEACIGIAKQKLKSLGKNVAADSRTNLLKLKELGYGDCQIQWPKIIGMRNALVHDYLNIEPARVEAMIIKKQFLILFEFCQQALS